MGGAADSDAKWNDETRNWVNRVAAAISIVIGTLSLLVALRYGPETSKCLKYAIVGFWVIAPPIYFWSDWVFLCKNIPTSKTDAVKHVHDLSRNIWLALVVVLIALFELPIFKP